MFQYVQLEKGKQMNYSFLSLFASVVVLTSVYILILGVEVIIIIIIIIITKCTWIVTPWQ